MVYKGNKCVLLFSGGRDSTLAAIRLSKIFSNLILVTVTSDHLIGINSVYKRLSELKKVLPLTTKWYHVLQPTNLLVDTSFYEPTCLPCHHAYVTIGVRIAEKLGASSIAFGYAGYQSNWPEQTMIATKILGDLLKSLDIDLILPVYDIQNIDQLKLELSNNSVSPDSLEQKCKQQVYHVDLNDNVLKEEIDRWENAIRKTLAVRKDVVITVLKECILAEI